MQLIANSQLERALIATKIPFQRQGRDFTSSLKDTQKSPKTLYKERNGCVTVTCADPDLKLAKDEVYAGLNMCNQWNLTNSFGQAYINNARYLEISFTIVSLGKILTTADLAEMLDMAQILGMHFLSSAREEFLPED